MIESLCVISAKFTRCILMINSCFSHAMKNCALSKTSFNVHFLLFGFWLLKILIIEIFCAKIVKLTNSLVEPRT
jgi:hypothetical protein